jgi:putative glutamine amidotransferase
MAADSNHKPRIGIPYRTRKEELSGERRKYQWYVESVHRTGGEPVPISLTLPPYELQEQARSCDAFVLTGSPTDVNPSRFRSSRHPKAADPDPDRERTDFALLDHAFAEHKPVLAICYGVQLLNVYRGGSLIQHISTIDDSAEVKTTIPHPTNEQRDLPDYRHPIRIEPGTRIAQLARAIEAGVNSSHHQSILEPGEGLRIVARAPDGVIEAVEWTGDSNWVTGVQWHPERMAESESLADSLFHELMAVARKAPVQS